MMGVSDEEWQKNEEIDGLCEIIIDNEEELKLKNKVIDDLKIKIHIQNEMIETSENTIEVLEEHNKLLTEKVNNLENEIAEINGQEHQNDPLWINNQPWNEVNWNQAIQFEEQPDWVDELEEWWENYQWPNGKPPKGILNKPLRDRKNLKRKRSKKNNENEKQ